MFQAGDTARLKTALVTAATLSEPLQWVWPLSLAQLCRVDARSPRQAKLLDILVDRSDWEDYHSDAVMAALDDPKARGRERERESPGPPVLGQQSPSPSFGGRTTPAVGGFEA